MLSVLQPELSDDDDEADTHQLHQLLLVGEKSKGRNRQYTYHVHGAVVVSRVMVSSACADRGNQIQWHFSSQSKFANPVSMRYGEDFRQGTSIALHCRPGRPDNPEVQSMCAGQSVTALMLDSMQLAQIWESNRGQFSTSMQALHESGFERFATKQTGAEAKVDNAVSAA